MIKLDAQGGRSRWALHNLEVIGMRFDKFVVTVIGMFALVLAMTGLAQAASVQGKWETNMGTMFLEQHGHKVHGTYAGKAGKLEGVLEGHRLKGKYTWKKQRGVFELVFNRDATRFKGKWSRKGAKGEWEGRRVAHGGGDHRPPDPNRKTPLNRVDFSSRWKVEDARNGRNHDYHRVPWTFSDKGYVRAGDLWRGLWGRMDQFRIKVILMDNRTNTDEFEVMFFNGGREFVAQKNGRAYRYGRKM